MTSDEIVLRLRKCAADCTSAWYRDEDQRLPAQRFAAEVGTDAIPVLLGETLKNSSESHTAYEVIVSILRSHKDIRLDYIRSIYERLHGKTGHYTYMNDEFRYVTNTFSFHEALNEVYLRLEPHATSEEMSAITEWKAEKVKQAQRKAEFERLEKERKAEFERSQRERRDKEQREKERLAIEALAREKEWKRRKIERARRVRERRCVVCGRDLSWWRRIRRSEYHRRCYTRGGYVPDTGESALHLPGD